MLRCHGSDRRKWPRDIEVDQPAVLFGYGRPIFPADSQIEREAGAGPPGIGHIRVVNAGAKIFVRIAERKRTGVGDTEQKAGEIGPGQSVGECELAARILLAEQINLLATDAPAERNVVPAAVP